MTDIVFMFEVHQPFRVQRRFREKILELIARGKRPSLNDLRKLYFDEELNRFVFQRVASRCYLPANETILGEIERFKDRGKKFKVSYSISGVLLEQAEMWYPEVVESFRKLAKTGLVEFLDQTYYHSLAFLVAEEEFVEQVKEHRRLMKEVFGYEPRAVENTEFIYNNYVAKVFERLGYKVMLTEGVERVLGWRSPNYVYKAKGSDIKLLMRNYKLSDDIGFRFGARWWNEYPLTADKYSAWLASTPGDVILIAIDYETFGEHFPAETGIFEFLRWLPGEILKWEHLNIVTPTEAVERNPVRDEIDVPEYTAISWADLERDLSAWLHNSMQWNAFNRLKKLWLAVKAIDRSGYYDLWRLLSISDHFYYMSTKGGGPGDVHTYFSPYGTALDAYVLYSDVLSDLESRVYSELEKNERARLRYAWMRHVPPENTFIFYRGEGSPTGFMAYNMFSLIEGVEKVPLESVIFHQRRGDFAKWIEEVVGDTLLSVRISRIKAIVDSEDVRSKLLEEFERRKNELFG
ncbi:MAG: alpha-amylase [Thermoprotei archaeon]|nr:MAG: alpha-amylase [Thermoprotei archaeon]